MDRPNAVHVARGIFATAVVAWLVAAGVLLLPSAVGLPATAPSAPPSLGAGSADLAAAEVSLSTGQAPITGHALSCRSVASMTATCGTAAPQLRPMASNPSNVPGWSLVPTFGGPTPRVNTLLTYDASDGYVLLFGGDNASAVPPVCEARCSTAFAESWMFADGAWSQLSIVSPPAREGAAMTYDPVDGYVLLYGGELWCDSPPCPIDATTWEYHAGSWKIVPTVGPPARMGAAMTYDPLEHAVLLFGGELANGEVVNDTWTYTGGAWTQLSVVGPPADPYVTSMAYDAADGYLLLVDGAPSDAVGLPNPVTWSFGNGLWQIVPTYNPLPSLFGAWLTYDPPLGEVLLVGEQIGGDGSVAFNSTWGYFGGDWNELPGANPSLRLGLSSLAYDTATGTVIGFGGEQWANGTLPFGLLNDTWSYTTPPLGFTMSVSASPPGICALADPDCPIDTTLSRVTLSLETQYLPTPIGTPDTGAVIAAPTFSFVPYGEVQLPANLSRVDPTVTCSDPEGFTGICNLTTTFVREPGGVYGMSWSWSSNPYRDQMLVRAKWSASFEVNVLAPPFGNVPIDACTTFDCYGAGGGPAGANFTWIRYDPFANGSSATTSFPLGLILVETGTTNATPPPPVQPAPAPPPPHNGRGIIAVPPPAPPSSVAGLPAGGALPPVLAPVAAGAIAAGFTRIRMRRKLAMGVAAPAGLGAVSPREGARAGGSKGAKGRTPPKSRFE